MTYRVIQWATGGVGRAAIEGVLGHPDLELVGLLGPQRSQGRSGRRRAHRARPDRRGWRPTTSTRCSRSTPTA